jgi:hypothetical protein
MTKFIHRGIVSRTPAKFVVGRCTTAHLYSGTQHLVAVDRCSPLSHGPIRAYRGGDMHGFVYGLPRIPIPRTSVNKGKRKDRSLEMPRPRWCA